MSGSDWDDELDDEELQHSTLDKFDQQTDTQVEDTSND